MRMPDECALDLPAATHVADVLAQEMAAGITANPAAASGLWDPEYLAAPGAADRISAWRRLAAQTATLTEG